jgi:formylglycine-generating enzyme required for sulfatase activity
MYKEALRLALEVVAGWPDDARARAIRDRAIDVLRESPPLVLDFGGATIALVYCLPGAFSMGSPLGDADEAPAHDVAISRPFYMAATEVTQRQYAAVAGIPVCSWQDPARPVETVSWAEAVDFYARLSGMTGKRFRLPTEAEWEYAARAGSVRDFCFGDDVQELGQWAWYADNADRQTRPAGTKKPNAWGLYDMHGNVWEWCNDSYSPDYYDVSPAVDPVGFVGGERRVLRGGELDDGRHVMPLFRAHSSQTERSLCRRRFQSGLRRLLKPTGAARYG